MAKTHVANVAAVADVADVTARRASPLLNELPRYVSSAAGELGLLSQRPDIRSGVKVRAPKKTRLRRGRPIGSSLKGELLRAVYVRVAMWITHAGVSPQVATTDQEIDELLPYLIGRAGAERLGRSERERQRAISQMAYDWRAVIAEGVTHAAEDADVHVTFYFGGSAGERRFSLAIDLAANGGRLQIAAPISGAQPPISLTEIVRSTTKYTSPYMAWAEQLRVAALQGDSKARAAVMVLKGLALAAEVGAKCIAIVIGTAILAGLIFFALPIPKAHAGVIERFFPFVLKTWPIHDETPDNRLPDRLRLEIAPDWQDERYVVQWISDYEAVFTLREPERIAAEYRAAHAHPVEHLEWSWRIEIGYLSAPIWKTTHNPQLRVIFDRPFSEVRGTKIGIACLPQHTVESVGYYTPGVPPSQQPRSEPPELGFYDKSDMLVLADPKTHGVAPGTGVDSVPKEGSDNP